MEAQAQGGVVGGGLGPQGSRADLPAAPRPQGLNSLRSETDVGSWGRLPKLSLRL